MTTDKNLHTKDIDFIRLIKTANHIASQGQNYCNENKHKFEQKYLGGNDKIIFFLNDIKKLRKNRNFLTIFMNKKNQKNILYIINPLYRTLIKEYFLFNKDINKKCTNNSSLIINRLEMLEDIIWCLKKELINNFKKIENLLPKIKRNYGLNTILLYKQLNSALNSIDRLEVRGRDSAGISIFFLLTLNIFKKIKTKLNKDGLINHFVSRQNGNLLLNKTIQCLYSKTNSTKPEVTITITYKKASEIGQLGDNTNFIRKEIKNDQILHYLASVPLLNYSISSHTRWASIGSISEANCHPIDNILQKYNFFKKNIIHVCLNGEIDNYLELKARYINSEKKLQKEITTDTKIIPIMIEKYINRGIDLISAFRLVVNSFKGSHAIMIHTNLAPGKLLIAQKGSGQSMFIGLTKKSYIPTSEVYGFVEETNKFIRVNGDKIIFNDETQIQGQIFILDQTSKGKIEDIKAMYYDGTEIKLNKTDIKHTNITSKDIDRKGFRHYFLKEIYEAPISIKKTLDEKWDIEQKNKENYIIKLNHKTLPLPIQKAITSKIINKIFFIGQGTAGIAAQACSNILNYYLNNSKIYINSFKASEFELLEANRNLINNNLKDTLVIAITQSGSTTDTNHTIDIAKEKKAYTIAIVNRRDSDVTFKVDGVMYTSSGRDIEMSVASTKAFYSQIVAGAILGLQIASITQKRSKKFISNQIKSLLDLPQQMQKILNTEKKIKKCAQISANKKKYWAIVGSGFNKISADEIRVKLSELCYKTISSDFIEDKKHIDLSSEPLILVCAAGSDNQLISNIVKNIAIFKAHKAIPIVIANEKENRFNLYAENVLYVPKIDKLYAPILNTLVGHLWGYHAALSINKISKILSDFRDELQIYINICTKDGFDAFEIIRKKTFITKINKFYKKIRKKMKNVNSPVKITNSTDILLLLKYLSGKLPASDFEIDFNKKGTALEIFFCFFEKINESINDMSRPIDAIRHQAKTVTVGSSSINDKVDGILFKIAKNYNINISQIENKNIIIMKNLQKVIHVIQGTILYKITKLDPLGEPNAITEIKIQSKSGITKAIPSRVEKDNALKGTKRLVVTKGDIYVGKGRKDGQNVIIIPICSNVSEKTDKIRHLLLLNVVFRKKIPLKFKIKALGEKYNNIKYIVQENSVPWNISYINKIKTDDLFGFSAEKIGEYIVSQKNKIPIFINK